GTDSKTEQHHALCGGDRGFGPRLCHVLWPGSWLGARLHHWWPGTPRRVFFGIERISSARLIPQSSFHYFCSPRPDSRFIWWKNISGITGLRSAVFSTLRGPMAPLWGFFAFARPHCAS